MVSVCLCENVLYPPHTITPLFPMSITVGYMDKPDDCNDERATMIWYSITIAKPPTTSSRSQMGHLLSDLMFMLDIFISMPKTTHTMRYQSRLV